MSSGVLDIPGAPACSIVPADTIKALSDGRIVPSDTGATIPGINAANHKAYVLELVWRVADGTLTPTKFAAGVHAAGLPLDSNTNGAATTALAFVVADALWATWILLEGVSDSEPRARLVSLTRDLLLEEGLLPKNILMKVAESELLAEAGVAVDAKTFHRKEIRLHTKLVYAQQKFNLLREDNEGYAKLIAALAAFAAIDKPSENAVAYLRMRISCLIGVFELDPNRVLDLLLDAWQAAPSNPAFVPLLDDFNSDALVHILGFKFTQQGVSPSPALFDVAARLIATGRLTLEAMLGHLMADGGDLAAALERAKSKLQVAVDAIGVANLTQTAEEREKERQARAAAGLSDTDALPYRALYTDELASDMRLPLLTALLRQQAWAHAGRLWLNLQSKATEDGHRLQPAMDAGVSQALCDAAAPLLAPLCQAVWPNGRWMAPAELQGELAPFPDQLLQVLQWLGPYIALDPTLFTTLCRVLAARPSTDPLAESLLAACVLPGLALMPDNTAAVAEAWAVMQPMHYTTRFRLYAGWLRVLREDPVLRASQRLAVAEAKRVLRRIHVPEDKKERREVLRPFGRRLGKVALSAPLSIASLVSDQARSYPNMIDPLMDAVKFFSPLAFDVLTFVLVDELARNTGKIKDDGISTADWLTNLAVFTGMLCKKYPFSMEVHAILQYVANQLKCWQSMDLLVLEKVITSMTGFVLLVDVSESQFEALAGGQVLQQLTFNYKDAISAKAQAKGATRLLAALQQRPEPEQLAVPLLILLAQQQVYIQLKSTQKHLKLIAEMYDRCHLALLQYLKLLTVSLDTAAYAARMPSMPDLKTDYGLDADVAMLVHRPLLRPLLTLASVAPPFGPEDDDDENVAGDEDEEGGSEAEDGQRMEVDGVEVRRVEEGEVEDGEHTEGKEEGEHAGGTPPATQSALPPGCPSWWEACAAVTKLLSPSDWQAITPEFYIMFWSLTYSDIHVPHARYTDQLRLLKDAAAEGGSDAADAAAAIPRLQQEYDAAIKQHEVVLRRLKSLRADWLGTVRERSKTATVFLQHCLLPRVLSSPEDAAYCAHLLRMMHDAEFVGLHTIGCYDKILKDVVHIIYCLTDNEAANFGLFLAEVLRLMEEWRSSQKQYESAAASKRGFAVSVVDVSAKQSTFEQFRKINYKWQNRALKIFVGCLKSGEYVQIRNALIVLNKVNKVYPTLETIVDPLLSAVQDVVNDTRQDLKLMAQSYSIYLKQQLTIPGRFVPLEQYGGRPPMAKGTGTAGAASANASVVGSGAAAPSMSVASGRALKRDEGRLTAKEERGAEKGDRATEKEDRATEKEDHATEKEDRPTNKHTAEEDRSTKRGAEDRNTKHTAEEDRKRTTEERGKRVEEERLSKRQKVDTTNGRRSRLAEDGRRGHTEEGRHGGREGRSDGRSEARVERMGSPGVIQTESRTPVLAGESPGDGGRREKRTRDGEKKARRHDKDKDKDEKKDERKDEKKEERKEEKKEERKDERKEEKRSEERRGRKASGAAEEGEAGERRHRRSSRRP